MPDQDSERRQDPRGSGWRPVPDPTTLTTEALHREIRSLERIIAERIEAETRLTTEKLAGVENQFKLVERQRVEQKKDAGEALAAALLAAKEAVKEQTEAATKDIDALGDKFDTALSGISKQISTLTGRITVIEASKIGSVEQKDSGRQNISHIIAAGSAIIAFISLMVAIIAVVVVVTIQ
jgi:hypothetical protein